MAWRAFLAALFGLGFNEEAAEIYRQCTGRSNSPGSPATEAWLACGRRGGKSFVLALIAVFLASFRDWRPYLGPGERATVMILAADRKQARVIMRYVKGLLESVKMLARTIEGQTQETISLSNSVTIEIHTASFRTVRGYTIVAALCDELAFWPVDETSSRPDVETIAALRPAMATVPGAMLLCASSPYSRRGALWEAYRRHYGKDGDPILVWQAATRTMNPTVPQAFIDAALEEDRARASAEYLGEFRGDLDNFLTPEAIDAVTSRDVPLRSRIPGTRYYGFCDPSGGAQDSFTIGIAHLENKIAVLDCIAERKPPFSPAETVLEFSKRLKAYGVNTVVGDRYSGEFVRELFRGHGITYRTAKHTRSEIYLSVGAAINSGLISLLDNKRLANQLSSLERRTHSGGRESVDHSPGSHDDLANSAAGALNEARISETNRPAISTFGVKLLPGFDTDAAFIGVET